MLKVDDVQTMLERCADFHGHLCLGQVAGVRMAKKGLELVAAKDIKDLIVMVENDRCITDAILLATGVRLGRRSLKFYDYGKMAATFVNLKTNLAWRVHCRGGDNQMPKEESMAWALAASDEELLSWRPVSVDFGPGDLPGPPSRIVTCQRCGETVLDHRDISGGPDGTETLCKACALGSYFQPSQDRPATQPPDAKKT